MERALRFKARDGKPFRRAGLAFGPDWTEVDPAAADPEAVTRLAAEESLDAQVQDEAGDWVALPAEAREMARAQLVALDPRDWAEIRAEAKAVIPAERVVLTEGEADLIDWLRGHGDMLRGVVDVPEGAHPLDVVRALVEAVARRPSTGDEELAAAGVGRAFMAALQEHSDRIHALGILWTAEDEHGVLARLIEAAEAAEQHTPPREEPDGGGGDVAAPSEAGEASGGSEPATEEAPAEEKGGTGDDAPPPPPARKGGGKAKGD